jgi:probable F420-dependent oxidoreductase
MRIGISCYDLPAQDVVELAVAAERAGFASIWLGEHIVAPVSYDSTHPTQPGEGGAHGTADHNGRPIVDLRVELVDPLVTLAAAAANTSTLELATGIYLLPLRHPLLAARAAATVANLANGRLRLGIGSGWLREEFAALDSAFHGRTARMEEALAVLRAAWRGGPFEFHGAHYDFSPVQVSPHPVPVQLVLGGNSEPALQRAVALADGWFSSGIPTFDEARRLRDRLEQLTDSAGRAAHLATTWRIAGPDPALVNAYATEGFEELLIMAYDVWIGTTLEERIESLENAAAHLGLRQAGLTGAAR